VIVDVDAPLIVDVHVNLTTAVDVIDGGSQDIADTSFVDHALTAVTRWVRAR